VQELSTVAGFPLKAGEVRARVKDALVEDSAFEDITTIATVHKTRRARAHMVARQNGVIAGVAFAVEAFRQLDVSTAVRVDAPDGTRVAKGDTVLVVSGHARPLLSAERVALNFLQRLSGIATLTRRHVDAVAGCRARILDTRKTTPGWRALEKYAVRCGGGTNHRMDLAASVLIKDNHLAALEGQIARAVTRARELAGSNSMVQVECDSIGQVREAIEAGADMILLDNMKLAEMRECVTLVNGRARLEASGGVTLETVRPIAETGVDFISVGALTHSAPAMNLALDFD
jgi:nicotinate-nucleotide pyrophosphorylase (carboxylating)